MEQIEKYDQTGGFNPYELTWDEEIVFPSTRKLTEYGNRIYNRYPARSVFLVPRAILFSKSSTQRNVLDPFMGSGTTAVETVVSGNIPYGVEMDPFARKIAEVSSSVFTEDDLHELEKVFFTLRDNWVTYDPVEEPDLIGISRWFKPQDYIELRKLKACIDTLTPERFKDFMLIVYADCIKPVSKMERQSTKPYISSKYEKVTKSVADSFEYSFKAHYKPICEMSKKMNYTPQEKIHWLGNNATNFEAVDPIIDLAITSPPYINAFDYTQCIKVESAMCGLLNNAAVRELRSVQVGHTSRRKNSVTDKVAEIFKSYYDALCVKDSNSADTCLSYFNDICSNLQCVYKALKPGGEYHMIIGDSRIKDIDIPTHEIIAKIATDVVGYDWFGSYRYSIKDHRTSIPRDKDTSKIQYEFVIMLRK